MSFLLDTDICSAYLKNDPSVVRNVMLHFGSLHVSVISYGELLTWALRAKAQPARLRGVRDFLAAMSVEDVDATVAEKFAELRAGLLDQGRAVSEMDLLNAAIALVRNLTMVTHNNRDYAEVTGLALDDWLAP